MSAHPIVRQIVDRLHVSESNRAVIREVASRLKGGIKRGFLRLPRADRKRLMRDAVTVHAENRRVYRMVVTGRFS